MKLRYLGLLLMLKISARTHAEIVSSSADHYVLKHQAKSDLSVDQMWQRLIKPAAWWHPDHTYSGDSANLSLDATAGGYWLESWEGNSVSHGQVLAIENGKYLRLNAPFGPLQKMAVTTVWTITVEADGEGSRVTFEEICNGTDNSKLNELANAVNFVKGEAIKRLVSAAS